MKATLILHPTDGSAASNKALEYAADMAVASKAKLLVLHVQRRHGQRTIPPGLRELERLEHIRLTEADILRSAAERVATNAEGAARNKGVADTEKLVVQGDPAREIVALAKDRSVDTIVMGSRGLGDIQGLLLGSVSHKVIQSAPCTCIIVR
jgi:nucleotide-binding universal stress UspA family protein